MRRAELPGRPLRSLGTVALETVALKKVTLKKVALKTGALKTGAALALAAGLILLGGCAVHLPPKQEPPPAPRERCQSQREDLEKSLRGTSDSEAAASLSDNDLITLLGRVADSPELRALLECLSDPGASAVEG